MNQSDIDAIQTLEHRLKERIKDASASFLTKYDPNTYVLRIIDYDQRAAYNYVDPETSAVYEQMIKDASPAIVEIFHKLILLSLILINRERVRQIFPHSVATLFYKNFIRIYKNIESDAYATGFYLYPNDNFLKDLSVCALRLIPVGNQKVEVNGFSRKFFLKKGLSQFLNATFFYVTKAQTHHPFYQMHTDLHDRDLLSQFTKKGTIATSYRIAELLKMNSSIRGVFGSSWMNDPQLEHTSPIIFWGARNAIENGGKLFFDGTSQAIVEGATYASPKRTRLVKEGKYKPANYMLIWLRDDIIKWAQNQKDTL